MLPTQGHRRDKPLGVGWLVGWLAGWQAGPSALLRGPVFGWQPERQNNPRHRAEGPPRLLTSVVLMMASVFTANETRLATGPSTY